MPKWTTKHERAAFLIAEGMQTLREVAGEIGTGLSTLEHWKQGRVRKANDFPEFPARVRALREEFLAEVRAQGIAVTEHRIKRANDDWQRLQFIRRQRAERADMQHVPGGATGLLVRSVKTIGRGDSSQLIEEYEIDHALLTELRALETQVAKELGAITDPDGTREVIVRYVDGTHPAGAARGAEED
jgi:hypothetical protein